MGEGFHLTNLGGGVLFRDDDRSPLSHMAWTDPAYHNGWLALPEADGQVHSLTDLFGNLSPQWASRTPNGYRALAYFAAQNGCGTEADPVEDLSEEICPRAWRKLRLWIDANHNGISEPNELHTLEEVGVKEISLRYRESPLVDQFGNEFRYVSDISDRAGPKANRCYDVFVLTGPKP